MAFMPAPHESKKALPLLKISNKSELIETNGTNMPERKTPASPQG